MAKWSDEELRLIGASIYLYEGTKDRIDNRGWHHYAVEFTNNDPRLIFVFLKFLRTVIGAEESRIKALLCVYPDHDTQYLIDYWSKLTGIPQERFNKTILLINRNKKCKPSLLGTIKIRYHHKAHFLKIQAIITDVFGGVA